MHDTARPPVRSARCAELRGLLLARQHYPRIFDWLLSLYDRLLNSRPGRYLPFRQQLHEIHLRGESTPFYLRLGTTDWMVLRELMIACAYEAVFQSGLVRVHTIVDLGANIGLSIRLWQAHFPSAKIIAVEPDDSNIAVCRRNIAAGNNPELVTLIQACAGAQTRNVFLDRSRGEWATRIGTTSPPQADYPEQSGATVPVYPLPHILQQGGITEKIDLLKCDIEGAEQELFENCKDWLPLVRNLLIEIHDQYTVELFLADIRRNGGRFTSTVLDSGPNYAQLLLQANTEEVL